MGTIRTRWVTLAGITLTVVGCATTSARPAARSGSDLEERDLRTIAELIRAEDRREFDPQLMSRASVAELPEVRRRTVLASGRIRGPGALPLLARLLGDPDTAVAATAAFSLGQLGDTAASKLLVPWVSDESASRAPTVAGEAAGGLAALRTAAGRNATESLLSQTGIATARLEAVGPALLAVWRYPRPANLAPIARWLDHPDPEFRWRAAYALTRRPDPRATAILVHHVADADPRVRAFALRSLSGPLVDSAGIGAAAGLQAVVRRLDDPDLNVRITAVRALGSHTTPAPASSLTQLLSATEPHLVLVAAEGLARMGAGAAAATEPLRRLSQDTRRTPALRSAALLALARVAPADAVASAAILAADPDWRLRAAAARAFAEVGMAGASGLTLRVRDPDPRVVAAAVEATISAAGKEVRPIHAMLIGSLGAGDPMVRAAALGGLRTLADPADIPVLLDAYARAERDTVPDAALAAVEALGAIRKTHGDAPAHAFFARFRRSPDYITRVRVASTFGDSLSRSWGAATPAETKIPSTSYLEIVRSRVAPVLRGAPRPRARIVTDAGEIDIELFVEDAPLTVHNFLELARSGFFDGQVWPRVVPNFVIQGGDPRGDTSGGPGYAIRDEMNRHPYLGGTVGMALSGRDTGGSQFFITHSPQPHLDGGYTVFGRVVRGTDIVDRVVQGERITRIFEVQ